MSEPRSSRGESLHVGSVDGAALIYVSVIARVIIDQDDQDVGSIGNGGDGFGGEGKSGNRTRHEQPKDSSMLFHHDQVALMRASGVQRDQWPR